MKTASGTAQDNKIRKSIVAITISLLCTCAFAIDLRWEKSSFEESHIMVLADFTFHLIALFLVLQRPSATSMTTCIFIGALSFIIALPFQPIYLFAWLGTNATPLLFFINLIYLFCQLVLVYQWRSMWKKGTHKS